jgi:mono/diheme cytochrome c family protein
MATQSVRFPPETKLVTQGRLAFERSCAACHAKGPSEGRVPFLPGTFALSLKYRNDKIPPALEDRTDLTPEYIETVVRYGIFSMPPLGKTDVSDDELKAIGTYFRESSKNPNGPIRTGPNKVIDR